ncbi:MAG: hypothetical protein QMD65_01930 [Patescibacteria group bacterium]|nr:hypothetical protein [Patescibacteria group bacterium]
MEKNTCENCEELQKEIEDIKIGFRIQFDGIGNNELLKKYINKLEVL